MKEDQIFTKAFLSTFKPLKVYIVSYGKNGTKIIKRAKVTEFSGKGYQASTGEDAKEIKPKRQRKHKQSYKERLQGNKRKQGGKKEQIKASKNKASTPQKTGCKGRQTSGGLHTGKRPHLRDMWKNTNAKRPSHKAGKKANKMG